MIDRNFVFKIVPKMNSNRNAVTYTFYTSVFVSLLFYFTPIKSIQKKCIEKFDKYKPEIKKMCESINTKNWYLLSMIIVLSIMFLVTPILQASFYKKEYNRENKQALELLDTFQRYLKSMKDNGVKTVDVSELMKFFLSKTS